MATNAFTIANALRKGVEAVIRQVTFVRRNDVEKLSSDGKATTTRQKSTQRVKLIGEQESRIRRLREKRRPVSGR